MSNSNSLNSNDLFEFSVFRLDINEGLFVDGKPIKLAPKVFQTLVLLVENQGRIITKQELFDKVWANTFVEDNALSFNISQLRKTLAQYDDKTIFVETVPKRGFRFNANVIKAETESLESEMVYEKYQIQELIIDEKNYDKQPVTDLSKQTNNRSKVFFTAFVAGTVLMIGGVAFWQWQKNAELRSFDSLRSVKLTSWKSTRSFVYLNYNSSHNGKMIAYSSSKEGNEGIFIKQINGEDIRITKDKWINFSPIWSPDDQQIAFASVRETQSGIYLCPSLGGTPILLRVIGEGNLNLRDWSKDGSSIFYEIKGNLFKINIESKEIEQITNFAVNEAVENFFSISPSEDKVAFSENTAGQTDIWLIDILSTDKKRLTNDSDIESNIKWHPDNNRLFYSVVRNNNSQINLAYSDGREPVQVTRGDAEYNLLDVSLDGAKIFYSSYEDKSDIGGIDLITNDEFSVADETESEFWADPSPDGRSIAYLSNPFQHAISQLNNSNVIVRSLSSKVNLLSFNGFNQKWLPNNNQIAFMRFEEENRKWNLWTIKISDGEEKKITKDGIKFSGFSAFPYNRSQPRDFSWSNDNQKFVYIGSNQQNVWLEAIAGNETINISNNSNPNLTFQCPIWSNDGKRIAFISLLKSATPDKLPDWSVWLFENGNTRKIFSTNESLRVLGWTESNNELLVELTAGAMKASPIDIKLLQLSLSGNSKIVNSFEKISALSMALSPNGENVVFTKEDNGKDNIYLVAISKNGEKKITDNADSHTLFGSLAWSTDNKTIYFDKQERINTISMFDNFK